MPDRPSDLPSRSIATSRPRRPEDDHARRVALLAEAATRWLCEAGWATVDASTQARTLGSAVGQWLDETRPDALFARLPSLADRLCKRLPPSNALTSTAFITAFAHSLIARAVEEVAMEASRAGHASVFAGLRPYLHSEPPPGALTDVAAALDLSQVALVIALSRLRRRLRERIESGLALWALDPETRNTLRRQLRESLIGPESIP